MNDFGDLYVNFAFGNINHDDFDTTPIAKESNEPLSKRAQPDKTRIHTDGTAVVRALG